MVAAAEGAPLDRGLSRRSIVMMVLAGVLAVGSELAVIAGADEQSVLVAVMSSPYNPSPRVTPSASFPLR